MAVVALGYAVKHGLSVVSVGRTPCSGDDVASDEVMRCGCVARVACEVVLQVAIGHRSILLWGIFYSARASAASIHFDC